MKRINLNSAELKDFLKHIVTNNQHLQSLNKRPVSVNVEGEAGIGKTTVLMQLGQELGLEVVKLNLAQLEEIGDLVGFPVKEHEVVKEDGTTKWIPESLLLTYINSKYKPTGNKRMSHASPEWINGKKEGGILILDDWTRADQRFVQAVMEIK
jgi:MoxR-like ATPase